MLPTDELTNMIINDDIRDIINKYRWNKELETFIFSIKTNNVYEKHLKTLKEVYEKGYNIGNCGLTSRYILINLVKCNKDASLCMGSFDLLEGTKGAYKGNHAWVLYNNFYIDPTTRTCIPKHIADTIGYKVKRIIKYDNNDYVLDFLSEYNTYERYYDEYNGDILPKEDYYWYKNTKLMKK